MVIGHQKILDYLQKSLILGKVSHGYLFYGPEKVGKKRMAIEFAKILQCQQSQGSCQVCQSCLDIEREVHPDLTLLQPETDSQEITIAKIRDLKRIFSLYPYEGNYKIAIIDRAERMSSEAANALLKTLEEPKGKAVLILISAFPDFLPLTIKSRLQQIKFSSVQEEILKDYLDKFTFDELEKREILKISQGKPGILQEILEEPKKMKTYKLFIKNLSYLKKFNLNQRFEFIKGFSEEREGSLKFLDILTVFFRDLFLIKYKTNDFIINSFLGKDLNQFSECYSTVQLQKIIKLIRELKNMILFSNTNPRLCLEVLMLEI